jgi:hypothetical protein
MLGHVLGRTPADVALSPYVKTLHEPYQRGSLLIDIQSVENIECDEVVKHTGSSPLFLQAGARTHSCESDKLRYISDEEACVHWGDSQCVDIGMRRVGSLLVGSIPQGSVSANDFNIAK